MLDQTARIGGAAPDVTFTRRSSNLQVQATLRSLELQRSTRSGTTLSRPKHRSTAAS